MMKVIKQSIYKIGRKHTLLYTTTLLLVLAGFSSCIKDDISDCFVTFSLRIKALNAAGQDITYLGEAGEVQLYVFDHDEHYIDRIIVSADEVQNLTSIERTYNTNNNDIWVVAWSNLNGNQNVIPTEFTRDITMEQALVQLKRNTEGYADNPDDLFYGIQHITTQSGNSEIVINRKTALINITVNGLEVQPEDNYYFIISGAQEDAYNFKGNLTGSPATYRQTGQLTTSAVLFSTVEPFRIYPLSDGNSLTISIYNGQELVASVNTNDDGSPIIPLVGVTNNILIDLTNGTGSLEVRIEVTDWNDIYHWLEW